MGASDCLIPSALTARERCTVKKTNPVEYSHLYHYAHEESNVWKRLMKDSKRRDAMRPKNGAYQGTPGLDLATDSGFAANNRRTSATQVPRGAKILGDPPVQSLHNTTLRSYRKNYPIDFMAAVRPQTKTINQTLGIWGYQDTDKA